MDTPNRPTDEQMKADRKQDVLLLLEHLAYNEQTTIRLILDCLYDVGATNLINQKVRLRPLNRATRGVARMSKPVFRAYALRWFQKNCPELIANWLFKKVEFSQTVKKKAKPKVKPLEVINPDNYTSDSPQIPAQAPPQSPVGATPVTATVVSPEAQILDQQVRQLRTQVKLLTGTLAFAIAALGATVVIMGGNARFSGYPFVEDPHTVQLKTISGSSEACPTSGEDSKLTSVR